MGLKIKNSQDNVNIVGMYLMGCGYTLIQRTMGIPADRRIERLIAQTAIGRSSGEGKILIAEGHTELTPIMRTMVEVFSKQYVTYNSEYIQTVLITGRSYDESKHIYTSEELKKFRDAIKTDNKISTIVDKLNSEYKESVNQLYLNDNTLPKCESCQRPLEYDFVCCPYCGTNCLKISNILTKLVNIMNLIQGQNMNSDKIMRLYDILNKLEDTIDAL